MHIPDLKTHTRCSKCGSESVSIDLADIKYRLECECTSCGHIGRVDDDDRITALAQMLDDLVETLRLTNKVT